MTEPTATMDAAELGRTYQDVLDQHAPPPLARIVEALLFVGGAPLAAARAEEIVRGLTAEQFAQALTELNLQYRQQGRPYLIQPQGQGWVLTLKPRFRGVVEKLY